MLVPLLLILLKMLKSHLLKNLDATDIGIELLMNNKKKIVVEIVVEIVVIVIGLALVLQQWQSR